MSGTAAARRASPAPRRGRGGRADGRDRGGWRRHAAASRRHPRTGRDETGTITLVEVAVCVALLGLLGAIVTPMVASFTAENSAMQATYDGVDQLIEPSQIISRFVHEAVAPAPQGSTTATWSVFTANTGPDEAQFTADVGTYGQPSDAGPFTAYGPALVTIAVQRGSDGKPALVGTLVPADKGTCPGPAGSDGTACTWTGSAQQLFSVPDLTGVCVPGSAGCDPAAHPVFSYLVDATMTSTPSTSCSTSAGVVSCPLDQVLAVQFTFASRIAPGLPNGTQSEAYLLAPFYDAEVG